MLGDQDQSSSQSGTLQTRSSSGSHSSRGRGNISSKSSSNSRRGRQSCKYFLNKQDCPFGDHCRYRHSYSQEVAGKDESTVSDSIVSHRGSSGGTTSGERLPRVSTEVLSSLSRDESTSFRAETSVYSGKPKRRQVCRYFLNSSCKYGDNCTFYHPKGQRRPETFAIANPHLEDTEPEPRGNSPPFDSDSSSKPLLDTVAYPSLQTHGKYEDKARKSTTGVVQDLPLRQHRASANRGREPAELNLGDFLQKLEPHKSVPHQAVRQPEPRPAVTRPQPKKVKNATDLREVELQQLEVMFPDCQLVEKSKQSAVYRINFTPSDPEWNTSCMMWNIKGKKSVPLLITIPAAYPTEVLDIVIADDQGLNPLFVSHGSSRVQTYIETEARAFCGTLMLRSIIYWIEGNIVTIFTEALKQEGQSDEEGSSDEDDDDDGNETGSDDKGSSGEYVLGDGDSDQDGDGVSEVALPAKRGTEVRLVGVKLSEGVATVKCSILKVVVICSRCKTQHDVTAKPESHVSESCVRCHSCFTVVYHASLLHAGSTTLGFLDLLGCTVQDMVLLQCELIIVCLECGRENVTRGLSYGQVKDSWCRRCHSKLALYSEQCKLVQHQPGSLVPESTDMMTSKRIKKHNPLIKEGYPLPELGTCLHYKKSHRWLRFPCCGKVYPCDICHDSAEDHSMERATRMLCGFCAKEQPYTGTKPCVMCGSDLTNVKKSTYWEGGLGCRNKSKMSRNDRHKYAGSTQKTSSKKVERVGEKPKSK